MIFAAGIIWIKRTRIGNNTFPSILRCTKHTFAPNSFWPVCVERSKVGYNAIFCKVNVRFDREGGVWLRQRLKACVCDEKNA